MTAPRLTVAALLMVALILNWVPALDSAAEEYLENAIADNLVIYGTARTLNGLISVVQSIQLSISVGAGFGVNLGEILDPLNDLIERFSGFVLYALAGLGLQKMVLIATSSLAMKVAVSLALFVGFAVWLLAPARSRWVIRLAALLVLARFFFIVEVGTIAVLDKVYFNHQKEQAHTALELARDQLGELRRDYLDQVTESGLFSGSWTTATRIIGDDNQNGIADLTASAIVELIVIMLVRGLLLPLLFVWAAIYWAKLIIRSDPLVPVYRDVGTV